MKEELSRFLFKYKIMPYPSTGVALAKLLMGRHFKIFLGLFKPHLSAIVQEHKLKQKSFHNSSKPYRTFSKGEEVYVKDFTAAKQKWIPESIQKANGPLSYVVVLLNGNTVKRHVDNIKARQCTTLDMTTILNDDEESFQLAPELTSVTPSMVVSENPTPTDNSTSAESATS